MFIHQVDAFADESRPGPSTNAHANKVKMCHHTKVRMSPCHLGKAAALTDGGTAFPPEPKPPSLLPPRSDINTPKVLFCTQWHHHTCSHLVSITSGIQQQLGSFVTREISCYPLKASQHLSSHMSMSDNFTAVQLLVVLEEKSRGERRGQGSSSGDHWGLQEISKHQDRVFLTLPGAEE